MVDDEIRKNYMCFLKEHYVGRIFGKYDLILDCKPSSSEQLHIFMEQFREWAWTAQMDGKPIQGCVSSLVCYEVLAQKLPGSLESANINTYSFFRISVYKLQSLFTAIKKIRKKNVEISFRLLWNPSTMSYTLKASGEDFAQILYILHILREEVFMQDFCTFVALRSDCNDTSYKSEGLTAMINVKLGQKGLSRRFLSKFKDSKIRLGYFDLIREVKCQNLNMAFDAIKETRLFLMQKRKDQSPNRTATILTFDPKLLMSKGK